MKKSSTTVLLLFVFLSSTQMVRGATTAFTGFTGFGSVSNAVNLYAVPNSKIMSVGVYQDTPNGPVDVSSPSETDINLSTKNAIDAYFRLQVAIVSQGALTNTYVNKDGPFHIFGVTSRVSPNLGFLDYLYFIGEFSLVKSADGSYHLPSFSTLSMELATTMLFEIPRLEWARIEPSYNPSVIPYSGILSAFEEDSRINPQNQISITQKYIEISTDLATSGTSGPTLLKISLVVKEGTNHNFKIFGPLGTQVPETPIFSKNLQISGGQVFFDIIGGDPGRVLSVQCSENSSGPWTDVDQKIVVPLYKVPLHHKTALLGTSGFYKVRSSNDIPFLGK